VDPRRRKTPSHFRAQWNLCSATLASDAGTLTCRGKFETADLITGEAEFSPARGRRDHRNTARSKRFAPAADKTDTNYIPNCAANCFVIRFVPAVKKVGWSRLVFSSCKRACPNETARKRKTARHCLQRTDPAPWRLSHVRTFGRTRSSHPAGVLG